jgi:hypothetical protein
VTTPDIAQVMMQAMQAEDQRRQVASASPGLGALLPMEQPPSGPSVGKYGVGGDIIGEGYAVEAEITAVVHKSYGPARPVYAGPAVAGDSYPLGVSQPALRHVQDIGDGQLLIEGRSAPTAGFDVMSPPARPGLLARLLGRLRGRQR